MQECYTRNNFIRIYLTCLSITHAIDLFCRNQNLLLLPRKEKYHYQVRTANYAKSRYQFNNLYSVHLLL